MPYAQALALQRGLAQQRQEGIIPDTLLLLEHPPTITVGRRSRPEDFLTAPQTLARRGVEIVQVDRGGEMTYHAPGQLVGYPILDLRAHGQDLHCYLRDLEEVLILALAQFGLAGTRVAGRTGVWVEERKIAAIGIKVARWVSLHGFALNVSLDLAPMRRDFVPCGIADRDVVSLAELLPQATPSRADVEAQVVLAFCRVFSLTADFL